MLIKCLDENQNFKTQFCETKDFSIKKINESYAIVYPGKVLGVENTLISGLDRVIANLCIEKIYECLAKGKEDCDLVPIMMGEDDEPEGPIELYRKKLRIMMGKPDPDDEPEGPGTIETE